jgi:hypothetical protein
MNERIKELANEALLYVSDRESPGTVEINSRLEKFAELIVKYCADYMNSRTEDWDAKLRWIFNDGSGYMEVDIDSLLKEHFGIKE